MRCSLSSIGDWLTHWLTQWLTHWCFIYVGSYRVVIIGSDGYSGKYFIYFGIAKALERRAAGGSVWVISVFVFSPGRSGAGSCVWILYDTTEHNIRMFRQIQTKDSHDANLQLCTTEMQLDTTRQQWTWAVELRESDFTIDDCILV